MCRGCRIYISDKCRYISSDEVLQFTLDKCENRWMTIYKCESSKAKAITIGGIYRHPNQNLDDFIVKMDEELQRLIANKTSSYILGDLNVNIDKKKEERLIP